MKGMTYHESYGIVSKKQLAAYRKHNISPSDHDSLVDAFGMADYEGITEEVERQTKDGAMFSFLHIGREVPRGS